MTTLVTGASGFLGGVLVRELLALGRPVRVLIRENEGTLAGLELERVRGDVRQPEAVATALEGVDTVFHLAAKISITGDRDGSVRGINVEGARTVARAARAAGVRRMIHVGSVHALDLSRPGPVDEDSPAPGPAHPRYDQSKAEGIRAVLDEVEQGLDAVVCMPSGILGPLDLAPSRLGQLLVDLGKGRLPSLLEGGFDFVDVRDVVAGLLLAEQKGQRGRRYILSGHYWTVRELGEAAAQASGVPAPRMTSPMALARLGAPFWEVLAPMIGKEPGYTREGLHALRSPGRLSNARARAELGYAPRPLSDTMRDAYASLVEHGLLDLALPQAGAPR